MTNKNVIYVALTIDDGPRHGVTEDIAQYLKQKHIPATWYTVRSNIEQFGTDEYYRFAQGLLKAGHEIAIHEALPRHDANVSVLRAPRRPVDPTEHVPPFPSRRFWSYRNNDDWGAHLRDFKAELLSNLGVDARFLRVPGGLYTELADYRSFMNTRFRINAMLYWMNQNYRTGIEYSEDEKLASLARVVGKMQLMPIYRKLRDFLKWIDQNEFRLWGGPSIRGSRTRKTGNERNLSLNYIDGQSWTAEIGRSWNNAESVIRGRFRRFGAFGQINEAVAPYVVILTHDNPGYYSILKQSLERILNMHPIRDGEIKLEFVTMSKLYETVSNDPMNKFAP